MNDRGDMRLVFMGTPAYVLPVLEALLSPGFQVVGVYTQPDRPSGRGRVSEPPPVKSFALEHGIRVFQPASLRRSEVQSELASLSPDVIVVAAYGKILPSEVLNIPPYGCVNVHPSLLPQYRGPSPVATAILEGKAHTGTTLMLLDEGMDTGPILAARQVPIDSGTTTEILTPVLLGVGADLLSEVLPLLLKGKVTPQPQDDSRATVTRKLEKRDGEVNWGLPAEEIESRLRAFTPWPGLFTYWQGKMLKILSAKPLAGGVPGEPGLVVPLDGRDVAVGVVTGRGIFGLKSLQMEGRRAVNSEEFVRGYGNFLGSALPS
ncbi:MAG: methionyl-tRNA formyltransferase [Dehalococcoidia bacterium]|nr:methionyl-tRNA formyltransferase [Dehalococcoidia bacterium]